MKGQISNIESLHYTLSLLMLIMTSETDFDQGEALIEEIS